jgi:hypothetical protein
VGSSVEVGSGDPGVSVGVGAVVPVGATGSAVGGSVGAVVGVGAASVAAVVGGALVGVGSLLFAQATTRLRDKTTSIIKLLKW